MTDAERWARIEALVDAAADIAPADRPAFLDRECRTPDGRADAALREEAEALLALDADASRFFDAAADRLASVAAQAGEVPAPERVGPWRLVREIGRGGMGTVHLAERADGRFDQTAALKLVRPGLADGLADRFRAERQILARLDHPAIARLIDGGQADDGRPFLVMEHVDGEPVTAYCDRRRLAVNERIALFESVCEAVQFAHSRLVVHRDLKPSNVLVAETDAGPRVKLLDFGIAKLLDDGDDALVTTAGERMMTPEYAAPEQVRGEATTTATDVYALGVLLYELLTGARPTAGARGRHAVEAAVLNTEPARPSDAVTVSVPTGGRVPPDPAGSDAAPGDTAGLRATTADRLRRRLRGDLDRIVLKALAKEPERRYASAAALADDLKRHVAGLPIEARPASTRYRMATFARRHRVSVALAALALVAVVGGAGAALWQARAARAEATRAEAEAKRAQGTSDFLIELLSTANPDQSRGDTLTVPEAIEISLATVDEALADEPMTRAAVFSAIAWVMRDTGDYARSDSLYGRASAALRIAGAAGADTLVLASDIASGHGSSLWSQNRFAEAEPHYRQALALSRRLGDPEAVAGSMSDLALVLRETGRDAEALALVEQALAQYRAIGGPDDPSALIVAGNFAGALIDARQLDRARTVADETLAGQRRVLGAAPHPDVSNALSVVGSVALGQGRYADAEAAFRETHAMRRALYGDDHENTAGALGNLAHVVLAQGRPAEALPMAQRSLAVYERTFPDNPGWTVIFRTLVGLSMADAGDAAAAVPLLRRAVADGAAYLEDSPNTDLARGALALALDRAGQRAEAQRVLPTVGDRINDARGRFIAARVRTLRARLAR